MTPSTVSADVAGEPAARPQWARRSERGSAAMLRVMTWISLRLGRRAGRCVLPFIVLYFLLLDRPARRASRFYLRRALGREPAWREVYRHFHAFASTIHDRIYLVNDRFDLFEIEIRGAELVTDLLASGRGSILMGAHLGSFEVLRAAARAIPGLNVTMVMYEENARKIKAALAAVNPAAHQDIVALGHVGSMLEVRRRLHEGVMIGILGDRTLHDDATMPVSFLGSRALLPTGPFRIAALLRQPVIYMAGLYLGANRYRIQFEALADFSAIPAAEQKAAQSGALLRYAAMLEKHCRATPYNWFNFFDFWQTADEDARRRARA